MSWVGTPEGARSLHRFEGGLVCGYIDGGYWCSFGRAGTAKAEKAAAAWIAEAEAEKTQRREARRNRNKPRTVIGGRP